VPMASAIVQRRAEPVCRGQPQANGVSDQSDHLIDRSAGRQIQDGALGREPGRVVAGSAGPNARIFSDETPRTFHPDRPGSRDENVNGQRSLLQ